MQQSDMQEEALNDIDDRLFKVECDIKRALASKHKKLVDSLKDLKSTGNQNIDEVKKTIDDS